MMMLMVLVLAVGGWGATKKSAEILSICCGI